LDEIWDAGAIKFSSFDYSQDGLRKIEDRGVVNATVPFDYSQGSLKVVED
jgi:hypothetical protein